MSAINPKEYLIVAGIAADLATMAWYGDERSRAALNPLGFVRIVVTSKRFGQWLIGNELATFEHGGACLLRKYEYPNRQLFFARIHSKAFADELARHDIRAHLVELLATTRLDHSSMIRAFRVLDQVERLSVEDVSEGKKVYLDVEEDGVWLAPTPEQDAGALFSRWAARGLEIREGRANLGTDADVAGPLVGEALQALEDSPARFLVCRRQPGEHFGF